jgi:hypothetical protein
MVAVIQTTAILLSLRTIFDRPTLDLDAYIVPAQDEHYVRFD